MYAILEQSAKMHAGPASAIDAQERRKARSFLKRHMATPHQETYKSLYQALKNKKASNSKEAHMGLAVFHGHHAKSTAKKIKNWPGMSPKAKMHQERVHDSHKLLADHHKMKASI